jgi:molybdopterin-binding protein
MLKLANLSKRLGEFTLQNISLEITAGDYFILLGPSGAGKSVLLEVIAGLEKSDSGKVFLAEQEISNLSIQDRSVGLVFQDLALFPHMTVKQNIAFPIRQNGLPYTELVKRVNELAEQFSISHLLHRFPKTLSGGEQQRVALARTLAKKPKVLLLDEPLASLDVELKTEARKILRELNRSGQTIVHVTHDYEEAISLGSKIAVMHNGKIEQSGIPEEVFSKPASSFVASLGGIRNFFKADLISSDHKDIMVAKVTDAVSFFVLEQKAGNGYVLFPENSVTVSDQSATSSAHNSFLGTVVDIYSQRYGVTIAVDIGVTVHATVTPDSVNYLNIILGKKIWVSFKASSLIFISTT